MAIDFEEPTQFSARIASSEAIGTERNETSWQPRRDLIGHRFHVVGRRDDGTFRAFQRLDQVWLALRLGRMQPVPSLDFERIKKYLRQPLIVDTKTLLDAERPLLRGWPLWKLKAAQPQGAAA